MSDRRFDRRVANQLFIYELLNAHVAEFASVARVLDAAEGQFGVGAGFRSDLTLADKSKVSPTLPAPRRSRVPGRFRAPVVRR